MRQAVRRLVPQATKLVTSEALIASSIALRTSPASSASVNEVMKITGFSGFHSSSFASSSLSDVLRNEIEYEKQNYAQPEVRLFCFTHTEK